MKRRGFTLIELLVVIAIIAVLVSLLAPGLRMARRTSANLKCQANQKQIAAAWQMYIGDFRVFPLARSKDFAKWVPPGKQPLPGAPSGLYWSIYWSFGGVHWYGRSADESKLTTPLPIIDPQRPINPYVSNALAIQGVLRVFDCPLDDGNRYAKTQVQMQLIKIGPAAAGGQGGAVGTRMFEQFGTSYEANDWMYCIPGSRRGEVVPTDSTKSNFAWWLGPQHMRTSPWRFVIVGDSGVAKAGRFSMQTVLDADMRSGWWHGVQIGNLAFFDGSVRREVMGDVTRPSYTFYMDETKHADGDPGVEPSFRTVLGAQ